MGQKGNGDIGFFASFKADENWAANNGWIMQIKHIA